ncbi:NACHT and WD40 domain protein [Penicillium herquei]|nr:NACHT and WD40 domain protein [Penicillium herquei]
MPKRLKGVFKHLLHREDDPRNLTAQNKQDNIQANSAAHHRLSVSSQITENSTQSGQTPQPQDLWKAAYEKLDETQRPEQIPTRSDESDPRDIIDEVVKTTKEEYEEHCQGASGKFKETAHKIINAALSFKDNIGAAAALDPTQHAASAWKIVSLGLTMAKNHSDLRDAMFESSEYLADILTYCSFVEKKFYREESTNTKTCYVENSLIRLYKAILCYVAQVQKWQKANTGRRLLDTLASNAASKNPLTALKESVKTEKDELHKYIGLTQYLRHNEDTAKVLLKIDELANTIDSALKIFKADQLHAVDGALYDSFENRHMETCLPNTRTELIRQVSEWIESDGKLIFWINGMAGTGKSTISQTIAHICKEQGSLGATFFFKKTETDRGNARYLIPTIMKQLVTTRPELAPAILQSLKNNESIGKKNLHEQFTKLFLEPLKTISLSQGRLTTVIVIDALDECDGDEDLRVIMRRLFELEEVTSIHLRVFLTSRPELRIRLGFSENENHQDLILHEIPQSQVEHDIRLFLEHKLEEIQRDRCLPSDWLGDDHRERLLRMAVPLFIIVATACRWIKEGKHPRQRLERLLEAKSTGQSQMDQIYLPILQRSLGTGNDELELESLMEEFRKIIGTIIFLVTPLSIESLALLLKVNVEEISETLDSLHSVLYIKDEQEPVRILHLSFRDYLLTTQSPFRIDEQATHEGLASYCLDCMDSRLQRNICQLSSYAIQHEDIDSQAIEKHLTADLQYSCRYWVHHVQHSKGRVSMSEVLSFLKKHFLHWLEVLALIGEISKATGIIEILKSRTWKDMDSELSNFLEDARRFALQNIYIARVIPLQLYYAGLLFAPKTSVIRDTFSSEMPTRIQQLAMEDSWTPNLHTLEGHTENMISIALSPDGHTLASAACGDNIILWDTATGEQLQKVKYVSSWRASIAFSPDGLVLASVCRKIIILWEMVSMKELQRLSYGNFMFQTLSFSPDGKTLASGTMDGPIILWSTTINESQILHGHSGVVTSFSFSPSEQILASGSFDTKVILWDTATCEQQQELIGHFSPVNSVAFSPDGLNLVSGSLDGMIILWGIATGKGPERLAEFLSPVTSVEFDPVTGVLASGNYDNTIILWDIGTGTKIQILPGHSDSIVSLAFSSDGRILASGSEDRTIKLWDVATCKQQQHGQNKERDSSVAVYSMAFSQDGSMLALGLTDSTLILWKRVTGKQQTLSRNWEHGISLAFSPDGSMLASTGGSTLSEVILWDTATGEQWHKLSNDLFSDRINALAFSPDGSTLAWSGRGIILSDTETGKRKRKIDCDFSVYDLAISPDGHNLAACLGDVNETIQLWHTDTGSALYALPPDGRTVAINFLDGTLQLWDTATDTPQILNAQSGSDLSVDKSCITTDILISGSWVSFRGERVLWLTAENSSFISQTSVGSMLALGYDNRRVAIFDFQQ